MTPQPDVLIAADGQAAAFRGADGRLRVLHVRPRHVCRQRMARRRRRRAQPTEASARRRVRCDRRRLHRAPGRRQTGGTCAVAGSVRGGLRPRRWWSSARARRLRLRRRADRPQGLARDGAIALRRLGDRFEETAAHPPGSTGPGRRPRHSRTSTGNAARCHAAQQIWRRGIAAPSCLEVTSSTPRRLFRWNRDLMPLR